MTAPEGTITSKTDFERLTGVDECEVGDGLIWLGHTWDDETPLGSALVAELRGEQL
jgi:hypothetical protein